jgi:hypothetical protein
MTKRTSAASAPAGGKAASAPSPRTYETISNPQLRTALEKAGGHAKLAIALGVSRQVVYRWLAIPDRFAVKCEELYGIPRQEIAPALFAGLEKK